MGRELPFDPGTLADMAFGFDDLDEDPLDPIIELTREAVESLPPRHRDVVECLMWGRMSKVEAAETLGTGRQYTHQLWSEAKVMLKERLGGLL